MVWGLKMPSDYGPFSPQGKFVGYHEQLEAAFDAMTAEKKAFYDSRLAAYRLHVSQCFKFEHGTMHGEKRMFRPVVEHEWPREYKIQKRRPKLGSLLEVTNELLLVDEKLKLIIEQFEPSIHQFRPIQLTYGHGEPYPAQYFSMVIGRFLSAFDPEQSPRDIWRDIGGQYSALVFNAANAAAGAMKKLAFSGSHLWRDRLARHPNIFLSDELRSEIVSAGLHLPEHFRLREV
jgi:hypothetical protein